MDFQPPSLPLALACAVQTLHAILGHTSCVCLRCLSDSWYLAPLVCVGLLALTPLWVLIAKQSPPMVKILKLGWLPVVLAMVISRCCLALPSRMLWVPWSEVMLLGQSCSDTWPWLLCRDFLLSYVSLTKNTRPDSLSERLPCSQSTRELGRARLGRSDESPGAQCCALWRCHETPAFLAHTAWTKRLPWPHGDCLQHSC